MYWRIIPLLIYLIFASCAGCLGQNLLTNGSFESGKTGWTLDPSCSVVSSGWNDISAADGTKFLAASGPVTPGYTYTKLATQSHSAPFGTGLPTDNFVVYVYASTYLHTNDGRAVSYALTLDPGYGSMGGTFHGGAQDAWVTAQTWGYYIQRDPLRPTGAIKPLVVNIELRDPLQSGEYLLVDDVQVLYGGPGVPEPPGLISLFAGVLAVLIAKVRKGNRRECADYKSADIRSGIANPDHHQHPHRLNPLRLKSRLLLRKVRLRGLSFLLPITLFFTLIICDGARAGLSRHDVLVIANGNSMASRAVANYYAAKRGIPASHVKQVWCPTGDSMSPADFTLFRDQVKTCLTSLGSDPGSPASDPISAIVLTCDIPHYVTDGAEVYGATDSALSACFTDSAWGKEPIGIYGLYEAAPGFPNPYFGDYNFAMPFKDFRASAALSTVYEAFPSPGFTLVRLLDANTALAAGGGGILFRGIRNGSGWTWSPVRGRDKGFIGWKVSCISVLDSTHAYACTGNMSKPHGGGTIITTSDGGLTWTRIRSTYRASGWLLADAFIGIDFADTQHGWAVGSSQQANQSAKPLLISTADGGATWQDLSSKLPASFQPKAISAADANNIWICGAGGAIYRSTDGGNTWASASGGAPVVDYNAIWVKPSAGAYKGWAAGDSGTIIRTENGTNWSSEAYRLTTSNITDFSAFSQDYACAAYGSSSFLAYTRPSGWAVESTGTVPICSAAFPGGSGGIAVSGTRYIFADSSSGWSSVYTGQDTPWRLRYLVTRLDGYLDDKNGDGIPDDIKAMIDRASAANLPGKFILDDTTVLDSGSTTPNKFQSTHDALAPIVGESQITWERTSTYLTGQTGVIGYTSWGMHDAGANSVTTFGRPFNSWVNGGVGIVFESADGRTFHRPYYVWALYQGGTKYTNKLSISGFQSSSQYSGFRVALYSASGTQLASGTLAGGSVQIDLTSVAWPADHRTYVQIFFPPTDPLHPNEPIDHARYPWSDANTDVYDNRSSGFALVTSLARNLLAELIREGATGGTANVDEPWSSYVGQPQYIFARYAQGFTWAESAYMGLAGLGWQEVAVGDPLMAPYAKPPTVTITAPPVNGQIASGTLHATATASPVNTGWISKVEFWLDDDTLLATDTTAPYSVDINTTAIADGVHTIEAVAWEADTAGNVGSAGRQFIANNHGAISAKISDVLSQPDGALVGLQARVVSAAYNGTFYIQDSDRSRGIRVRSTAAVTEGSPVTVVGKIQTVGGEREIVADGVY